MQTLELELAPSARAASEARTAVTRRFEGLSSEAMQDLRLLISELVANAILHAAQSPDDCIQVRVTRRGNRVHAEVIDCGGAGDIRPRPLDPESPGGFGLHLLDEISDRWGVRHDGSTCVWFDMAAPAARL